MTAATSEPDPEMHRVASAIARAGVTGITAKQLEDVTSLSREEVSHELERLATTKAISRIGRGLWILDRFHRLGASSDGFLGPDWYDPIFEKGFRLSIGRRTGEIQFNPNERRPVHRWWPYVQGFSAGFVEEICETYDVGHGSRVLDPFCGSGTVPVVARRLGASTLGIDMLPIATFVASSKQLWEVSTTELSVAMSDVLADRSPPTIAPPFLKETSRQFQPEVLKSLLRLKENLLQLPEGAVRTLLRLAFASVLIDSSNLKRSPCLGYATKLDLTSDTPYSLFSTAVRRMADDLRLIQKQSSGWGPPGTILLGNAGLVQIQQESVDLAITSPPYVNGMDYVMNYKIDLAWMDFIRSYDELARLRASMVACDNIPRGTASGRARAKAVATDDWLTAVVATIDKNIRAKGTYRRDDMGAIVTKYFDDLYPVIQNVYSALKPGARFVVVNGDSLIAGTYVPGDAIFARLAAQAGFEIEGFDVARTRRSGQRRGFLLRESVATLRKPGPFRPPRRKPFTQPLEVFGALN
jgi:DNA modification methylase